jgi:alanine-glyoxylate transaminase/serine-glyoxylate transaminase/serine-pyruvate transaminase
MLKEEGIEESWARHSRNHQILRSGLKDIGLEYLVPEDEQLPSLNAVKIPADVDDASCRKAMHYRHDIEIGAGLGELAGKIWRIGLMGEGSRSSAVERCLGCIEATMRETREKASAAA